MRRLTQCGRQESEDKADQLSGFTHQVCVGYRFLAMLKTILGLLLLVLLGQAIIVWQNERNYAATVALKEDIVPSQTTSITVRPYGTQTDIQTDVTTTQGEFDPSESEEDWLARHIATCAAVKTAWESAP